MREKKNRQKKKHDNSATVVGLTLKHSGFTPTIKYIAPLGSITSIPGALRSAAAE